MKSFRIYLVSALFAMFSIGVVSYAQSNGTPNAFFLNGAQGHLVKYVAYSQGAPVLGASSIVDSASGTSYGVLKGTLSTTAATTNAVTITGVTTTSNCVIAATNAAGATNIATTYISAVAANTVTVTHIATAALTYNIQCTPS